MVYITILLLLKFLCSRYEISFWMFQIWSRVKFQIVSSNKKCLWNATPAYSSTQHYFFGEFVTFIKQKNRVNIIFRSIKNKDNYLDDWLEFETAKYSENPLHSQIDLSTYLYLQPFSCAELLNACMHENIFFDRTLNKGFRNRVPGCSSWQ